MTSDPSNILMLGLRGSGKTTFLAALWHYLESGEMADQLEVPSLQPDRHYLNSIRNSWLNLKPVGRTSLRTNAVVSLPLRKKPDNSEFEVIVPDISGEAFRLQWVTRKALDSYVDFAKGCAAAFLFIHPKEVTRTHPLNPMPNEGESDLGDEPPIAAGPTWSPERSSTQVLLVELLQLLLTLREAPHPARFAIVISAWDLVKTEISPSDWLDSRLPLLSQYLRSNGDIFASRVFGISAQGGDLATDRDQLMKASVPSSRCRALQGDGLEHVSITAPLSFLLQRG